MAFETLKPDFHQAKILEVDLGEEFRTLIKGNTMKLHGCHSSAENAAGAPVGNPETARNPTRKDVDCF